MDTRIVDDLQRYKAITDYITNHDGCSPEGILEALKGKISRQKYYKCLTELRRNKIISEEYINKRDKALHINKNEITVTIQREFDNFEKAFFPLLEGSLIEVNKRFEAPLPGRIKLIEDLLFRCLYFAKLMIDGYNYKLFVKWNKIGLDKKQLERAQVITFDRLSKLYDKLHKTLNKYQFDDILLDLTDYEVRLNVPPLDGRKIAMRESKNLVSTIYSVYADTNSVRLSDGDKKEWASRFKPYKLEQYAYNALNSFECILFN